MKKLFRNTRLVLFGILPISVSVFFTGCKKEFVQQKAEIDLTANSQNTLNALSISPGIADAAIEAYNNAFLVNVGGQTYYKRALNDNSPDGFWTLALAIQGLEDAYERTGDPAQRELINNLCNSFLEINPPPYDWDGWNDDIAWVGLMLARGYQMTGTVNQLTQARYCFDFIWSRGWDEEYNGGGIWEQQPDMTPPGEHIRKEALSNNPTGQLALMIYESTGNQWYLDRARQIYDWSWANLFNPANGRVYTGIDRESNVDQGTAVYNQGTFVDFAALLYKITGDENVFRDAQRAADFVINNMTSNGIISNTAGYLNTWAAEYARGLGHLCKWNPQLWNTYYSFMSDNANAAWSNRRTDLNITWNGWDTPTPADPTGYPTRYVSAVSILQFTPPINPAGDRVANGTYRVINRASGLALDASDGGRANGTEVIQWGYNGNLHQQWQFLAP